MKYTYKTKNGKKYTVAARDEDRARCAAKKAVIADGSDWKGTQLVKISGAI